VDVRHGIRVPGGLIFEILALTCFLAAATIAPLAWRQAHPRPGQRLEAAGAHRIEEEKLARYS
jgi:hypothetical protein